MNQRSIVSVKRSAQLACPSMPLRALGTASTTFSAFIPQYTAPQLPQYSAPAQAFNVRGSPSADRLAATATANSGGGSPVITPAQASSYCQGSIYRMKQRGSSVIVPELKYLLGSVGVCPSGEVLDAALQVALHDHHWSLCRSLHRLYAELNIAPTSSTVAIMAQFAVAEATDKLTSAQAETFLTTDTAFQPSATTTTTTAAISIVPTGAISTSAMASWVRLILQCGPSCAESLPLFQATCSVLAHGVGHGHTQAAEALKLLVQSMLAVLLTHPGAAKFQPQQVLHAALQAITSTAQAHHRAQAEPTKRTWPSSLTAATPDTSLAGLASAVLQVGMTWDALHSVPAGSAAGETLRAVAASLGSGYDRLEEVLRGDHKTEALATIALQCAQDPAQLDACLVDPAVAQLLCARRDTGHGVPPVRAAPGMARRAQVLLRQRRKESARRSAAAQQGSAGSVEDTPTGADGAVSPESLAVYLECMAVTGGAAWARKVKPALSLFRLLGMTWFSGCASPRYAAGASAVLAGIGSELLDRAGSTDVLPFVQAAGAAWSTAARTLAKLNSVNHPVSSQQVLVTASVLDIVDIPDAAYALDQVQRAVATQPGSSGARTAQWVCPACFAGHASDTWASSQHTDCAPSCGAVAASATAHQLGSLAPSHTLALLASLQPALPGAVFASSMAAAIARPCAAECWSVVGSMTGREVQPPAPAWAAVWHASILAQVGAGEAATAWTARAQHAWSKLCQALPDAHGTALHALAEQIQQRHPDSDVHRVLWAAVVPSELARQCSTLATARPELASLVKALLQDAPRGHIQAVTALGAVMRDPAWILPGVK